MSDLLAMHEAWQLNRISIETVIIWLCDEHALVEEYIIKAHFIRCDQKTAHVIQLLSISCQYTSIQTAALLCIQNEPKC
jgi:hypothetical protein